MVKRYVWMMVIVLVAAVLAPSKFAVQAQTTPKQHVVSASKDRVKFPSELPAGIVTVSFKNDTEVPFSPIFARLNKGKTMKDLTESLTKGPAAVFAVISLVGGPAVNPKAQVDVTYDLAAGDYIFATFAGGPPNIVPLKVVEDKTATPVEAPKADLEVALVDFAFAMPLEFKTGPKLWRIANTGLQAHEIVIFQLEKAQPLEDVKAAFKQAIKEAKPQTPPKLPYKQVFAFVGVSAETYAWMEVNLEPGNYVALCFLPDTASKEPMSHFDHNMVALITVTK